MTDQVELAVAVPCESASRKSALLLLARLGQLENARELHGTGLTKLDVRQGAFRTACNNKLSESHTSGIHASALDAGLWGICNRLHRRLEPDSRRRGN